MLHLDLNKLNDKVSVKTELEKMAPTDWRVGGPRRFFILVIEHKRAQTLSVLKSAPLFVKMNF